jgi:hypothetical protein
MIVGGKLLGDAVHRLNGMAESESCVWRPTSHKLKRVALAASNAVIGSGKPSQSSLAARLRVGDVRVGEIFPPNGPTRVEPCV